MTIDPISDMLTTIRNGIKARLYSVETPASRVKAEIARVMKEAGYIADFAVAGELPKKLVITLKYTDKAVSAITELKRISKPGLRKYVGVSEIPAVLDGMGLAIVSTSKGIMSGAEAKKSRLGGEVICTVA
ncbi:MAG: 30S ribosomal protein S8 [Kiritimatiellae bacterium]|nr:30S ribosomal protein S8 [Kiritimatiellia bacterium]